MKLAVFAYSRRGCQTARRVLSAFPEAESEAYTMERFQEYLQDGFQPIGRPSKPFYGSVFSSRDLLIFVGSCGIAVREIAPHIKSKCSDPAVLCIDELGNYVISLLSGHIGGANALAKRAADAIGAVPVITTATDCNHRFSVDAWAAEEGFLLDDMQKAKHISAAILERDLPLCSDFPILGTYPAGLTAASGTEKEALGICVTARRKEPFLETLRVIPRVLHLGIGCRKGTLKETIDRAVKQVFQEQGLEERAVCSIASIDLKAEETGLLQYAEQKGMLPCFYSAEELKTAEGEFTPSAFVKQTTGVENVCERAAMMGADQLIVKKTAIDGVTVAVAEKQLEICLERTPEENPGGIVQVIGIGPGNYENMTIRADKALQEADVIIGYSVYVDLVKERYPGKEFLTTPMTQEAKRCQMALDLAGEGKKVAMVCSGDSGIYGMAALIYELRKDASRQRVEVIPGLTAACSGAALLGAPLTHDFSVISLSDRLTSWETIEKRLKLAAEADFSIVLYNPASKGRPDHVRRACDILLQQLPADRLCGVARQIGREGEGWELLSLAELREADIDMFCTVFIGNQMTRCVDGQMITPRGYRNGQNE